MKKNYKNYYEVLEVPTTATPDEIYQGYQKAKNTYSGESLALYSLFTEEECAEQLDMIEEAYSILSIPDKRRQYDEVRGLNNVATTKVNEAYALAEAEDDEEERLQQHDSHNHYESQYTPSTEGQQSNNFYEQESTNNPFSSSDDEHFRIHQREVGVSKLHARNRFSLDYVQNQEFELEIENTLNYTGEILRKIREYKNVSIPRMADMTKISKTYIRCMEEDNHEKMPALVYVRGFVYQYAKCLKLNPDLVATSYLRHLKSLKAQERTRKERA